MKGLVGYARSLLFHLRWPFMSSKERYACLWARTKKLSELGYADEYTVVLTHK